MMAKLSVIGQCLQFYSDTPPPPPNCFWLHGYQCASGRAFSAQIGNKMPGLASDLRQLIEGRRGKKNLKKLIKWLQRRKLIRQKMKCNFCHHKMEIEQNSRGVDKCEW